MRSLLLALLLASQAAAQSWTIPNFGGTVAPGVHAALHTPEVLSYSENMLTQGGTRVTRYGTTKALGTAFSYPFTGLHDFRSGSDSLTLALFNKGKWYYSNYGKYTYSGSNWRTKSTYLGASYITADTLHTPAEIRPYTQGVTLTVTSGNKTVSDLTLGKTGWPAHVEPGDSIFVDTSAAGSGTYRFVGIVHHVMEENRIILNDTAIFSDAGAFRIARPFDSAAVPNAVTVYNDAYVTNGVNPPHRLYDSLGTIYMQEADLAYSGTITTATIAFKDSVSDFQSWESFNAEIHKMRTRYVRIYDHDAAWSIGEWAGNPEQGLSTMYFCRISYHTAAVENGSLPHEYAPIVYNDANSLILLMPFLGDSTNEITSIYPYSAYYPTYADTLFDTTGLNRQAREWLTYRQYYIFSAAGGFETVVYDSMSTASAKTKLGGALWWVTGQNTRKLFDDSSFQDGTYFLHLLDKPQIRNRFRTVDSVTYRYTTVARRDGFIPPASWEFVSSRQQQRNTDPAGPPGTPPGGRGGGRPGVSIEWFDTYRYPAEPGDFIDWPNFSYWPIRHIRRSGDTSFIVTTIPVDTTTTAEKQSTKWEIVRARLPRFAGLARNNDNTVFGWGDPVAPELVSRSVSAPLRGGEPMNWNAGSDFVVTPTGEPVLYVVPFEDMELLFTRHGIWGAGIFQESFDVTEISQNVGLVSPTSVLVYNKQVFFQSDDGYYVIRRRSLQGWDVVKVSGQLDEVLNHTKRYGNSGHAGTRRVVNANRKGLVNAVYSTLDERIWLSYPDDTANVPTFSMTLDPENGSWDGFHNIGFVRAIPLYLRDTMRVLAAAPRAGQLIWVGTGESDTGQAIRSSLEGAVFNLGGDSLVWKAQGAWLTLSADNWNAGAADSLYFRVQAIPQNVSHSDSLMRLPPEANYTYTRPFVFHDAGSARYWYWYLAFKGDVATDRRWFQPIRMTLNFTPGRAGYP